ncbi:MAG TPA: hypothetical protein VFG54_12075 [Prolixibacteraceae bacterium]|nr:hypothetical protein [Prolixibacteraceae bacterium]
MNITNRIENIIIALVVAAITFGVMELVRVRPLERQITEQKADFDKRLDKQNAVIFELAKIEKYKIENRFEKLKPKESTLIINLDNKLTALELDSVKREEPVVPPAGKKGFLRKLKFW